MNGDTDIFKALVRHELKWKSSWKKRGHSAIAAKWRMAYAALLIVAGFAAATWLAFHSELGMKQMWFVTMGLPYMMAFFGVGMIKRECENDTQGWWLSLPYSRHMLTGAKWTASILQVLLAFLALFAAGTLYTGGIALLLKAYTLTDVADFMIAGFNWIVLIAGYCPFILALGLLSASLQMTVFRPASPVVWVIFMVICSFFYWGFNSFFPNQDIFSQFSGEQPVVFFPFPWEIPASMVASWLAGYLLIRLTGYLLDKKLSL